MSRFTKAALALVALSFVLFSAPLAAKAKKDCCPSSQCCSSGSCCRR